MSSASEERIVHARVQELSPKMLGSGADDPLTAEIIAVGLEFDKRARVMTEALRVLYGEGILEEPTIRAVRKQKETDGKHLIERYKSLLSKYKIRCSRPDSDPSRIEMGKHGIRLADALIIKVDFQERLYLHTKQELKISTELDGIREEMKHLRRVTDNYRGSSVAYSAEEKLQELGRKEQELADDLMLAELERRVMETETALLVAETLLANEIPGERGESGRNIKILETRLQRLMAEVARVPRRRTTRRRSRRGSGPAPLI